MNGNVPLRFQGHYFKDVQLSAERSGAPVRVPSLGNSSLSGEAIAILSGTVRDSVIFHFLFFPFLVSHSILTSVPRHHPWPKSAT